MKIKIYDSMLLSENFGIPLPIWGMTFMAPHEKTVLQQCFNCYCCRILKKECTSEDETSINTDLIFVMFGRKPREYSSCILINTSPLCILINSSL